MLQRKLIRNRHNTRSLVLLIPAAALSFNVGYSLPRSPIGEGQPVVVQWNDTADLSAPDSLTARHTATIGLNKHATSFVKNYLKREDEFLQKMKGKSRRPFSTIENVFLRYNLPLQLKYLAIVESGLDPKAHSAAGARGLWQLMPVTAREMGLKISGKTDERLNAYRSTVAAAKYLRSLYNLFDDWLLALAAYNSGPGPVLAAIKKAGSRNFWALQRYLPAESRGHVKRFIGVHYFFEEAGSLATQTRAEAKAWQDRLCAEELVVR